MFSVCFDPLAVLEAQARCPAASAWQNYFGSVFLAGPPPASLSPSLRSFDRSRCYALDKNTESCPAAGGCCGAFRLDARIIGAFGENRAARARYRLAGFLRRRPRLS